MLSAGDSLDRRARYASGGMLRRRRWEESKAVSATLAVGPALQGHGLTEMRIWVRQDLLRGRPTEVEETLGYVLQRATETGVTIPLTRFAYGVIRGVESYL